MRSLSALLTPLLVVFALGQQTLQPLGRVPDRRFDLPGQNLNDRYAKKPRLKNPHEVDAQKAVESRRFHRLLAAAGVADEPYYRLSATRPDGTRLFAPRWEDVPAPTAVCAQVASDVGVDTIQWKMNRAAVIEVSNALLDADQRRGPWSQPKQLVVADGWQLWVHPDNQPNEQRDVGVVWKVKFVQNKSSLPPIYPDGTEAIYTVQYGGVGPGVSGFYTNSPASPTSRPYEWPIGPAFGQYDRYLGPSTSTVLTTVAPAPDAYSVSLPDKNYAVAFCWVTHKGETQLTAAQPAIQADLLAWLGHGPEVPRVCARRFFIGNQPMQLGALGYHLYLQEKGSTVWVRQLARRPLGAAPVEEDWLFGVDNYQPTVRVAPPTGAPPPRPVARPQSWCNSLQLALWYTKKDIVVDVGPSELVCWSPICDPYWSCWGSQTTTTVAAAKTLTVPARTATATLPGGGTIQVPVTGSTLTLEPAKTVVYEDPLKLPYTGGFGHMKFGRSVTAVSSKATYQVSASTTLPDGTKIPGGWPALHVQNQKSVWEGMVYTAPAGVCTAGVTWSDWSGGQGFGTVIERCTFSVPASSIERPTCGIKVAWECAGGNGHSASELTIKDTYLDATVPWFTEHNQTADVVGEHIFPANFLTSRRAPCFWIDAPCTFNLRGGVYCQSSGTVFSLGWNPKVVVEDIFTDQPFVSLVDCANHQPGEMVFTHGKVNFFSPRQDVPQWLFRVNNSTNEFAFSMDGLTTQIGGASEILAYHPHRNRAKVLAEKSDGTYKNLTLVQADAVQWKAACESVSGIGAPSIDYNPAETGLVVSLPAQTIDYNGPATFTPNGGAPATGTLQARLVVPARDVTFNSLSSTQKKVRTRAWAMPNPLLDKPLPFVTP